METSLIGPKSYMNNCGLILTDGPHYLILSVQDPQIYSQIDGQDLLSLSLTSPIQPYLITTQNSSSFLSKTRKRTQH